MHNTQRMGSTQGYAQGIAQPKREVQKKRQAVSKEFVNAIADVVADGKQVQLNERLMLRYAKKVLVVCDFSLSVPVELRQRIIGMAEAVGQSNPYMNGYIVKAGIAKNVPMKIENIQITPETFSLNYKDIDDIIAHSGIGVPDLILVLTDEPPMVRAGQSNQYNITGNQKYPVVWWNLNEENDEDGDPSVINHYMVGVEEDVCEQLTKVVGIVMEIGGR